MEKNIVTATVTPATQLVFGDSVGLDGNIATAGAYVYGICKQINKGANNPAEIVVKGECYALVDGDSVDVVVENKLKADSSGHLIKATTTGAHEGGTAGTAAITIEESHIVAMEANAGTSALKKVLVQ